VLVDEAKLLIDKRVVAWSAWFVSLDEPLRVLRFEWQDGEPHPDVPLDGFLMAKTRFTDGMGENISGGGWVVYQVTSAGLLFQSTGENTRPDDARYPGARFIKDKICPSALLHVAAEEAKQWR
jgi:hypothetical protein